MPERCASGHPEDQDSNGRPAAGEGCGGRGHERLRQKARKFPMLFFHWRAHGKAGGRAIGVV